MILNLPSVAILGFSPYFKGFIKPTESYGTVGRECRSFYNINKKKMQSQSQSPKKKKKKPLENKRPPKKRRLPRNYIREKKDDRSQIASVGRVQIVLNRPHGQLNLAENKFR